MELFDCVPQFEHRPPAGTDDGADAPVVLLLGWTGSTPGALRKYAAVWNSMGCRTLAYTPGVWQLWRPATVQGLVEQLCEALTAAARGPVLVHMFSGAVGMFLSHIIACCEATPSLRVAGLVFDSCPVDYTRESGLAAVKQMALPGVFVPFVTAGGIVAEWWGGVEGRERMAATMVHPATQVPACYLYCEEGDEVTSAKTPNMAEKRVVFGLFSVYFG